MAEVYYRASQDDLEEIYKFHYSYTGDKRTRFVWNWEYGDLNPHNSVLIAVKDNGRIIATQGMMTIKVVVGEEIFLSGKNESLLVASEHRGKSLSSRLYNFALEEYEKEGISFLWGFSRKAIIPLKKANFRIFEGVIERRVLSASYHQTKLLIPKTVTTQIIRISLKVLIFIATCYSWLVLKISKLFGSRKPVNIEITEEIKDSNDIIKLYHQLTKIYPELIYIYQDIDYFKWRIKESPSPIKSFFIYENCNLKGYMYLKVKDKICELIDFTFIYNKDGKVLMRGLLNFIEQNNIGFVFYTGNKKNKLTRKVFNLLWWYGFIKMKGPNHFVLRNFNFSNEDKLFKIENWYLNDLWSEGI